MSVTCWSASDDRMDWGREMSVEHRARAATTTPLRRLGLAIDTADLVPFLCSRKGGWFSGQPLKSTRAVTSSIP